MLSSYYKKSNGIWTYKKDDEKYLKAKLDTAEEIEVVGIIKPNENALVSSTTMGGVLYTKDLVRRSLLFQLPPLFYCNRL